MSIRHPRFSPLLSVNLTQVKTADGVDLAGVVVEPPGRKKAALIWVHGLASSFDRGQKLLAALSRSCVHQRVGFFKFNTRGHHLAYYGPHARKPYIGASHERFSDCVRDIDAVIALARRRGYRRVILAGHSTGAQKVLYSAARRQRLTIAGLLLAGPASDIAGELKHLSSSTLLKRVASARREAQRRPNQLVPMSWGPWSYQRYVSLFTPGSVEEMFPYHRLGGRWTYLRKVRMPLLMISGQRDEYLDRPAKEILELFRTQAKRSERFTGVVVPGAGHSFHSHQTQFVNAVSRWLQTVV